MFLLALFCGALTINAQNQPPAIENVNPDPNGEPWYVGGFSISPEEEAEMKKEVKPLTLEGRKSKLKNLPSEIDNSLNADLFRPIFNQLGGSCSQASGVAYVFTYEMNYHRGLSSALPQNQYPSHYTYNFLNSGSGDNGSNYYTGWKIIQEIGCPSLDLYGGLYPIGNNGWMSGYDAYYAGMHNTIFDYWTIDVGTEAGLNVFKGWLVNHLDPTSNVGGLACFSAGATDWVVAHLPPGTPNGTDFVIVDFGPEINHAMTIVGYNDSIRYDHNGDGQYTNHIDINNDGFVDMADWEIGGLIMANSWGTGWADGGKAFMMYRLLADTNHIRDKQVHVIEPQVYYAPEVTMKLKVSHPSRKALKFTAGANNDTSATSPDKTHVFTALKNKGGDYPMTGTNDTIELGLDITDLYWEVHNYEPTRVFISINEKDTGNVFDGQILNFSVLTYFDGVEEYACMDSNVVVVNDDLTRLSVVIPGNGFYPPSALSSSISYRDVALQWQTPTSFPQGWEIVGYKIYRDGALHQSISDTAQFTYTDLNIEDGTYEYTLSCLYSNGADFYESMQCDPTHESILLDPVAGAGNCLFFDGDDDYVVGDTIDIKHKSFTMEFWAKRNSAGGDRMVIGHGQWGKGNRGMHYGFRNDNLYCGFYGDDISSDTAFTDPAWHHYAVTFDTATYLQSLYRDGELVNTRTSDSTYYGVGPVYVGVVSNINRHFRGYLDEVRVWDTVRTVEEIRAGMFYPVAENAPGLLVYYRFDEPRGARTFDKSPNENHAALMNFNTEFSGSDLWVYHAITPDSTLTLFAGYGQGGASISLYEELSPINGTVGFDASAQTLSYTPFGNWVGYDSLMYVVDDGTATDSVMVYINPENFPNLLVEVPLEVGGGNLLFSVCPNPVREQFEIRMDKPLGEKGSLRIYDVSGCLVYFKQSNNHDTSMKVDCDNFEAGSYIIELSDGFAFYSEKIIIVR